MLSGKAEHGCEKLDSGNGHILLDGGRVGVLLIHGLGGTPVELKFVAQAQSYRSYGLLPASGRPRWNRRASEYDDMDGLVQVSRASARCAKGTQ
jgi:hypothetical protein